MVVAKLRITSSNPGDTSRTARAGDVERCRVLPNNEDETAAFDGSGEEVAPVFLVPPRAEPKRDD
jgi:hypothetical protein